MRFWQKRSKNTPPAKANPMHIYETLCDFSLQTQKRPNFARMENAKFLHRWLRKTSKMGLWTVFWTPDFAKRAPDLVFYECFATSSFQWTHLRQ